MCFLKTLKALDTIQAENKIPHCQEGASQENFQECSRNHSYLTSMLLSPTPLLLTRQDEMLLQLINTVTANNSRLLNIHQKLTQNEHHLTDFFPITLPTLPTDSQATRQLAHSQELFSAEALSHASYSTTRSSEPLVEKLFGQKEYKYRLEVVGDVPSVIYKERNINLKVQLRTTDGTILNSNIVHLCLGVVDCQGEWVTENKGGETFMKGKTEVELYHGEASFLKIYPREVSRPYADGRLNFLVYAKPSVLRFTSNNSSVESEVDSSLIAPLLLKDICIRAKKKE